MNDQAAAFLGHLAVDKQLSCRGRTPNPNDNSNDGENPGDAAAECEKLHFTMVAYAKQNLKL